jgi:hypothetical protein
MTVDRKPRLWLALAVRAQGYRSQVCQQELQAAREREALAERAATKMQTEVSDVLAAWFRHRADSGGNGALEDGYRRFHAHVHAAGEQAAQRQSEAAQLRGDALHALRASFNRHHALQTLEQRADGERRVQQRRAQELGAGEAWALRRPETSEGDR